MSTLFILGFINESDVGPGGCVSNVSRVHAEKRYADFISQNRRTSRAESKKTHLATTAQRNACVVCLSKASDHACVPCFHLCVCRDCGTRLGRCPMCRGHVERMQRVFVC